MIQILTDSSCGISQEEAKRLGIDVISLCITFGEETFRDGVDLFSEAFYRMLTEGGVLPHTSQPAPYEFEERFERARAEGTTLLVLPISSALSGTLQCARMVKENGGYDNVYLYDSRCTTLMLELLVREAAKRAETLSIEELIAFVDDLRSRAHLLAGIDTLEYLAKGGRLNTATAAIGSLLRVKPIITIGDGGTIDVIGKKMGSKTAVRELCGMVDLNKIDPEYGIRFLYSMRDANVRELIVRMGLDPETVLELQDIGPVIGTHIGPDAFGYVYVDRKEE